MTSARLLGARPGSGPGGQCSGGGPEVVGAGAVASVAGGASAVGGAGAPAPVLVPEPAWCVVPAPVPPAVVVPPVPETPVPPVPCAAGVPATGASVPLSVASGGAVTPPVPGVVVAWFASGAGAGASAWVA